MPNVQTLVREISDRGYSEVNLSFHKENDADAIWKAAAKAARVAGHYYYSDGATAIEALQEVLALIKENHRIRIMYERLSLLESFRRDSDGWIPGDSLVNDPDEVDEAIRQIRVELEEINGPQDVQ